MTVKVNIHQIFENSRFAAINMGHMKQTNHGNSVLRINSHAYLSAQIRRFFPNVEQRRPAQRSRYVPVSDPLADEPRTGGREGRTEVGVLAC